MARTARASEWGHTRIFGNDDDDGNDDGDGGRDGRAGGARRGLGAPASRAGRSGPSRAPMPRGSGRGLLRDDYDDGDDDDDDDGGGGGGGGLRGRDGRGSAADADPDDLLQPRSARLLGRAAAGGAGPRRPGAVSAAPRRDPFEREAGGDRLIIDDKEAGERERADRKRRRARAAGGNGAADYDSDDSDMAEFKGYGGMDAAVRDAAKSVRFATASLAASGRAGAASTAGGGGGSQRGGRGSSVAGGSSRGGDRGGRGGRGGRGAAHSGERFRATKGGAGGDVKRAGTAVEPYAYWSLDRNMLNRRRGKQRAATGGLAGVVKGAERGARAAAASAGGQGAKRAQRVAAARKRARTE